MNNLLIKACKREQIDRPPIWLMRQAGRYLPEYQEVRSKHSIKEIIASADLTREVTLQPIKRFDFDAAIIFADILTPLEGIGIEFDFLEGEGPKIFNPIAQAQDLSRLSEFNIESVKSTLQAIEVLKAELDIPLIGFCGAPFTLSSYLIEAQSNPKLTETKKFMFREFDAWNKLQSSLVEMLSEYLIAQAKSGAAVLQIFDSWLGGLNPEQYTRYVEPHLFELIKKVRSEVSVPLVFFATGVESLYPELKRLDVDVMGIDWRTSLSKADNLLDGKFALQGNLDPLLLFAEWDMIKQAVDSILADAKELPSFVFNLGHGILPGTPVENVQRLVEYIKRD